MAAQSKHLLADLIVPDDAETTSAAVVAQAGAGSTLP